MVTFNPETHYYKGADGHEYPERWQAHWSGQLCMCGCGAPEASFNLVRDMLKACDRRGIKPGERDPEGAIAKIVATNPELTAQILLHFLTSRGVLEHGGHVGWSYLTAVGEEIVDGDPAEDG